MQKNKTPKQLALDILHRSECRVKVGAVIVDRKGSILSWGWNNPGDGFGCHAEVHAIMRANPKRLDGSSIYVAGMRSRNKTFVPAKPCEDCQEWIVKVGLSKVHYLDRKEWVSYHS